MFQIHEYIALLKAKKTTLFLLIYLKNNNSPDIVKIIL